MNSRGFIIPCMLLAVLAGCRSTSQEKSANSQHKAYPVISISKKDTLLSIPYVADIQAGRNVEIRSLTDGLLTNIFIKEGQQVKKGQLLFKINDAGLKIELNKADAAYKSAMAEARIAQVEMDRVKMLVKKGVIANTEMELVEAKYKALLAKADVAMADKNAVSQKIGYTSVTAPFDGIIDRIPLKEGSLVTSSSLLTTISDISNVFAYFKISENEFFQLQDHPFDTQNMTAVNLVLPDGSRYAQEGKLEPAESEIDGNTGSIAYKARFDNPQHKLRHGASGTLLITRPLKDVILLPQKTVFEIQDKNYVFVVDRDNIVRMKSIRVSQRLADCYIVTDGLQPKDVIVYEGIQTVKEGDVIDPRSV